MPPTSRTLLFFFSLLVCDPAPAVEFRHGDNLEINGPFSDLLFLSGGRVQAQLEAKDDVFIVGGQVHQTGVIEGNLFSAAGESTVAESKARTFLLVGGDVTALRSYAHDLLAAGGRVRLERTEVDDDVMLAGGRVEVTAGTEIADSLVAAGREVVIDGRVGGNAEITAGEVIVSGTIAKNLRVRADRVVLRADARVDGDLLHSARLLELEPGAQVRGQVVALPEARLAEEAPPLLRRVAGLLFFFGLLLAPAFVVALFPQFVGSAGERLRSDIGRSLGRGALILLLAPLVLGLLLVSVIGVPIALYAVLFFLAASVLAWAIGVFAVGQQLRHGLRRRRISTTRLAERRLELFGWTLLGALALVAVLWVPFVGGTLCFLIFLSSLGALYSQLRDGHEPKPKASPGGAPGGAPGLGR